MKAEGYFPIYIYQAPLGEFPLAAAGTYSFKFSGLPSEEMSLQFHVPAYTESNRPELENLSTELTAIITDGSGKIVCSVKGKPAGQSDADKWWLMSGEAAGHDQNSVSDAAYWHDGCLERHFSRNTDYTLRVTVANIDPKTPNVSLRAMLEGGGLGSP